MRTSDVHVTIKGNAHAAAAALAGVAPAGSRTAMEFEEQLARFRKLTGQAVDPQMREAILRFAETMPIQEAVDKVAWDMIGGDRPHRA